MAISNFLQRFRFDASTELYERIDGSDEGTTAETIMLIEKMEKEFRKVGLELLILGVNPDLGAHALTKSFSELVSDRDAESPARIRSTVLISITKISSAGRTGENARKNVNDWFKDYDLSRATDHFGNSLEA